MEHADNEHVSQRSTLFRVENGTLKCLPRLEIGLHICPVLKYETIDNQAIASKLTKT